MKELGSIFGKLVDIPQGSLPLVQWLIPKVRLLVRIPIRIKKQGARVALRWFGKTIGYLDGQTEVCLSKIHEDLLILFRDIPIANNVAELYIMTKAEYVAECVNLNEACPYHVGCIAQGWAISDCKTYCDHYKSSA